MKTIPLTRPSLGGQELQAIRAVLDSGWLTQGPCVQRFEQAFSGYTGAGHACAVSNCTAALHLALLAVGTRPGDVVITVSHSFIATANSVRYCQAEPYFIDIDAATLNLCPKELERHLQEHFERRGEDLWCREPARLARANSPLRYLAAPVGRLSALLVVHQVGMPADLRQILPLAQHCKIPVVEDAACAIGSEISLDGRNTWQRIGRPHGDLACFSFHPRKVITTGDGGMITTNHAHLDAQVRLLRQHSMNVTDAERHSASQVIFERYPQTGFNYRLTDLQAAVGLEQLRSLPKWIEQRRCLAALYQKALEAVPGIEPPREPNYARSNWQSYVIRLADASQQRPLMQHLQDRGISTRRGVMCAHLEGAYEGSWPRGSLPHSERARDTGVVLPLFPDMSAAEIARVADEIRQFMKTWHVPAA